MFQSEILNLFLQNELSQGNSIAEETTWPPNCEKLVILERMFSQKYDQSTVQYKVINDAHYWYAEYMTRDGRECLACRVL